jgi:hypothetical protein
MNTVVATEDHQESAKSKSPYQISMGSSQKVLTHPFYVTTNLHPV